ncbi:MAG: zinc ribbon domain-containing protein [Clostridiales bacterium]|nr:zinc ribbon domain-containing protein [Clostridiales bacterium]
MAFEVPFCNTFPLYDPKYRNLFVSINGSLLVESDDPNQNVPGSYQTVSIASNLAKIATADTVMKFGSIGYKDITARYGELVNNIVSSLKKRGFSVVGASIDPVTPDDASMARIKKQDEVEKMMSAPAQPIPQPVAQPSFAAAPVAAPAPAAPAQPQLMKFCIRCGTLASGTKFCTNCGSSLIRKN